MVESFLTKPKPNTRNPLMSELQLTQDQSTAYDKFSNFILDPTDTVFVLEGYSGTGKSTLVEKLIEDLPRILNARSLLLQDDSNDYNVELAATTNKAAENLAQITGRDVRTIHSILGLRVHTNYKTGVTNLKVRPDVDIVSDTILFIDEASYIDSKLLGLIFERTERCKIVFIGDPAQLLNVGCKKSPVFGQKFTTAKLEQVVRQADGSPITDLATAFRHTVNTGEFFSFDPDGHSVSYMERDLFEQAVIDEFTRGDWCYRDSKVLGWTNKCVVNFNKGIHKLVSGDSKFSLGDYVICNSYVDNKRGGINTDQLVQITGLKPDRKFGVRGHLFELDNKHIHFMPDCRSEWKEALEEARENDELDKVSIMTNEWIDLRAAYACTINKSQGSTFDKVYIDLDDIKKCRDGNQIARMLYVGVSRARDKVILTGDLV